MVGHRSDRKREFGWAAARLDDALNWAPARLAALLTALLSGAPRRTLRTILRDGPRHPSPNAGRIEAAFAGALDVRLGGELSYGGVAETRPALGAGRPPTTGDLRRAIRLSRAVGLAACLLAAGARR
jgi:adenosylcobinamide-phosphate synthase